MRVRADPYRWRWVLWGILAVVFLLVNLHRLSSAVLADRLMVAFGTSGAALGTLHAAFFYVYALMQLPAGVLADRAGPRRTATVGAVILNLGVLGFAASESYAVAFASRALIGGGGAAIFISMLRFGASWYRDAEFATMNGLTIAVAGLGGIMATTPLAVAAGWFGWRPTLTGLGLFGLALAAVVAVATKDTPTAAGFDPITTGDDSTLTLAEVGGNLRGVLAQRETWVVNVMLFCSVGLLITLLGLWGVPFVVQTYDVSVTTASWFTLLGSLGILVGPPVFGFVSDRFERRTVLLILGGLGYLTGFGLLAGLGQPPLALVALVYFGLGFLLGAFTLSYPVIKERHDTTASGVAMATVNGAGFLGAALFPTLFGFVLDSYWTGETVAGVRNYTDLGYRVSFGIAVVASLVALACSVWLYRRDPNA